MNLKPEELLHKLRNKAVLPNLIVIYGEDDYYKKQISSNIASFVYGDTPEQDREITYFEKDTPLGDLEISINTYPFFSGKSLLILRDEKLLGKTEGDNAKKQQERLGEILGDIPEYCTVFVCVNKLDARTKFYKGLAAKGVVCNCEPIRVYNLGEWLYEKAEALGGRLSTDARECIMEYLEPLDVAPLQLLESELEKIALYAGDRKVWKREDVEAVFATLPEVGSFAISNAMAEHKLTAFLELLAAERKKGTAIIKLCGGLMFQLRRMLQIKELQAQGYNNKQIGDSLNIKFQGILNKAVNQCRRFEYQDLQEALLALAQLNIDLRTGGRDYQRLEEIMVRLLSHNG